MWAGEETRDGSEAPSASERARSDLETFTPEAIAVSRRQPSESSSMRNGYKSSARTPGVLRSGDPSLYLNGKSALPAEKAFSIQIGWRLFKISGASIMSDGKHCDAEVRIGERALRSLQHHHISLHISRSKRGRARRATHLKHCTSIGILILSRTYVDIFRVRFIIVLIAQLLTPARLLRPTKRWSTLCQALCRCTIL